VIAISPRLKGRSWNKISFASTLYLCPILDLLLAEIPSQWQAEVRLGLQEALVNAVKHGNNLDPSKTVEIRFSVVRDEYWWIISDHGNGFYCPNSAYANETKEDFPHEEEECGRGLFILHQIFDKVHWNNNLRELSLCKVVNHYSRGPILL
jgi:anti-sigma regulatory factor (Ser/Thr protein kinase)